MNQQTRYMFAIPNPVLVVAKPGAAGDWAAYIAGVPVHVSPDAAVDQVTQHGAKLPEEVARAWFPGIEEPYRP